MHQLNDYLTNLKVKNMHKLTNFGNILRKLKKNSYIPTKNGDKNDNNNKTIIDQLMQKNFKYVLGNSYFLKNQNFVFFFGLQ